MDARPKTWVMLHGSRRARCELRMSWSAAERASTSYRSASLVQPRAQLVSTVFRSVFDRRARARVRVRCIQTVDAIAR